MKIKTNMRFTSSIGSSKNLWTYQGFFLVALKFHTFSLWFNYNHWVEVLLYTSGSHFIYRHWVGVFYKNLNFSFLWQIFQYCLLGLKENLNRHALRPNKKYWNTCPRKLKLPNKQYWNTCPRKLKFRFLIENPDLTFINETRTKGMKFFCYLFSLLGLCTLDLRFRGVDIAF